MTSSPALGASTQKRLGWDCSSWLGSLSSALSKWCGEEFVEKARAEKAAKAALRAVPGPPSLKEVKIEEEEQKKKKKEEKKKKARHRHGHLD